MKGSSIFYGTGDEGIDMPFLRNKVSIHNLKPGMIFLGMVWKVVNYGAVIDIGVELPGLLHFSKIPYGTYLGFGDIVTVEIISVDKKYKRIGLGWVG